MARHSVDKATAGQILEAVRAVVGHLSRARLGPPELRPTDDQALVQIYGRTRRLLGYLQTAAATYRDPVVFDLGDDDRNLLASSVAMEIGILAERLRSGGLSAARTAFAEQSIERLGAWVLKLATRRLESIPGDPNASAPEVQSLARDIADGLGIDKTPDVNFGATPQRLHEELERREAGQAPGASRSQLRAPSSGGTVRIPRELLDPRRIHHPSLRTLVGLDLAGWERSLDARDLRTAAVHLRAVLESVALDRALPRQRELGLVDPPETWGLTPLVLRLLPELDRAGRGRLRFLDRCVGLVRPGLQLDDPTPITARILGELAQLVSRVLRELGVVGMAESTGL